MKRILFLLALVCLDKALHAQYVYTIKADSVKITNSCDTAELIIENHTQTVPGFLFNKGRGRTEFRKAVLLNDSTLVLGNDTLTIRGITTANNGLSVMGRDVQLGQPVGAVGGPATLQSNREMPMDGYNITFKNIGKGNTGLIKLQADETKTNAASYIDFLSATGDTISRINFTRSDILIGDNAGISLTGTNGHNTFIGTGAGRFATTANGNTSIGSGGLYSLTTGNSNVSVGGALARVTTGNNNIAVGYTSGFSIATGSDNIAMGGGSSSVSPLQNLKAGSNNIAFGAGCLSESTTPTSNFSGNVGIGIGCMQQRTHGNYNVGIGYRCGFSTQFGTNNVAIGDSSLTAGTFIGDNNLILGSNISNSTSFSSNNILVGPRIFITGDIFNAMILGYGITNSRSNVVRLGRGDQNIIMGITSDVADNGNRVQVLGTAYISDTLKLPNIIGKTDTATYKPMVVDASGNVFKMAGWNTPQITRTAVNDAGYSALSLDYLIAYTSLSAARTVTLPAASAMNNHILIVKDESGDAGTYNITVNVTAGGTIDGAASRVISSNYGVIEVYSNGSQWFTK
jgi:hypothetical protein